VRRARTNRIALPPQEQRLALPGTLFGDVDAGGTQSERVGLTKFSEGKFRGPSSTSGSPEPCGQYAAKAADELVQQGQLRELLPV